MTEQTELKMKLTITADELFALHPLPWTHHLLLIKDANGRQVIHTGGLYDQQGRPYSGPYLSGINALLVEAVNARVSASPAAPVVEKARYEKAHDARYMLTHPVHPDIVVLWFLALKSHWFDDPGNMFFGQREQAKAYLYKWVEAGELADDRTTLEITTAMKFGEWLESSWTPAAASPASTQEDELVDEVQHRMDQVVEAAVEWHQAGREGGEWFEAAEKPGAAINSLLELREKPKHRVGSARHPYLTHEDHQRMKETLDSLSDYPTNEEAEAALQAYATSGKEIVNSFIERLLKENLELQARLEILRLNPPDPPPPALGRVTG